MLCCGPPQITMSGVPWTFRALVLPGLIGLSTNNGIGAAASSTPQVENTRTSFVEPPPTIPAKRVGTWSTISTRINAVEATEGGGAVTPITELGKLTLTWLFVLL